jgi:hypothetical protein
MLESARGVPMGHGRRVMLRATCRMLHPAPVAALVQHGLSVCEDGVRQGPDTKPPAEQEKAHGRSPEAAQALGGWGRRRHVGLAITRSTRGRMQPKLGPRFASVREAPLARTVVSEMNPPSRAQAPLRRAAAGLLLLFGLLLGPLASAHLTRVSTSEWMLGDGAASAELQFFQGDFVGLFPPGLPEGDVASRVLSLVTDTAEVRAGDAACALKGRTIAPNADGWSVKATWTCPGAEAETWAIRLGVLELLPAGQTHLARVSVAGDVVERIARSSSPSFEVTTHPSVWAAAKRFLRLGVEHIFTGYDHIAFLLALLLLGGRFLDLVKIVTSFTIAHSVTLALAALGILHPPARAVEALIAASIVAVAAENLWVLRGGPGATARVTGALGHRWRLTFAFGLVHGFGFASALQELHLPRSALVAGLVSFNLGVEVGQVAIVALAFPILRWLRTVPSFQPWGPRLLSGAIAAFGLVLLVLRLDGR